MDGRTQCATQRCMCRLPESSWFRCFCLAGMACDWNSIEMDCLGSHPMATRTWLTRLMRLSLNPQDSSPIRNLLIRRVIFGIMVRALVYAEIPYFMEDYLTFEDRSDLNLDYLTRMKQSILFRYDNCNQSVSFFLFLFRVLSQVFAASG